MKKLLCVLLAACAVFCFAGCEDGKCDVCGESFKLSAGAVAGIVAGSAAAAGLCGFSLFWFVIKKKSFADLIAVFKK